MSKPQQTTTFSSSTSTHIFGTRDYVAILCAGLTGAACFAGFTAMSVFEEGRQKNESLHVVEGISHFLLDRAQKTALSPELTLAIAQASRGDGVSLGSFLEESPLTRNTLSLVVSADGRILGRTREASAITLDAMTSGRLLDNVPSTGRMGGLSLSNTAALASVVPLSNGTAHLVTVEPLTASTFRSLGSAGQEHGFGLGIVRAGRLLGSSLEGVSSVELKGDLSRGSFSHGTLSSKEGNWKLVTSPSRLLPEGTQFALFTNPQGGSLFFTLSLSALMAFVSGFFGFVFAGRLSRFSTNLKETVMQKDFVRIDRELLKPLTKEDHDITEALEKAWDKFDKTVESVQDVMNELSASATHQMTAIARTLQTMEEMNRNSTAVSNNCREASTTSSESSSSARNGGLVINDTIIGIERINRLISQSTTTVHELQKSSEEIGQIINVINGIAEQTNLLALNASIEAARAGETGKGFAVVADEVRKLAEETTRSTKAIGDMIAAIQRNSTEAVKGMDMVHSETENGVRLARSAGTALEQIVGQSEAVSQQIRSISEAVHDQLSSARRVATNMQDVSDNLRSNLLIRIDELTSTFKNIDKK